MQVSVFKEDVRARRNLKLMVIPLVKVTKIPLPAYSHGCDVCKFCRSKNLSRPLPTSMS